MLPAICASTIARYLVSFGDFDAVIPLKLQQTRELLVNKAIVRLHIDLHANNNPNELPCIRLHTKEDEGKKAKESFKQVIINNRHRSTVTHRSKKFFRPSNRAL